MLERIVIVSHLSIIIKDFLQLDPSTPLGLRPVDLSAASTAGRIWGDALERTCASAESPATWV